jgi:acetolactate synthase-1/2/3 large subunit
VAGATYPARAVLAARAEEFLDAAASRLRARRPPGAPTWPPSEIAAWRTRLRAPGSAHGPEPEFRELASSAARDFLGALRDALPRDAIVVTDSGTHQTLVRRHFEVRAPRGLIVPSDFQSMGFGLPAAIGARLAAPDRPVVAVIGDGGFAMVGLELLTALRERIGITLVVFNDGRLNRIRLQQLARYGHASGCDVLNPDFEGLAMALGVDYLRAGAGLESALRAATARPTPTLVEVVLGDSMAIHVDRAKGLARGLVRRAVGPSALRRIKRRVARQGS